MKPEGGGHLARFSNVIIACTSLPFARDIENKILCHNAVHIFLSQSDDALRNLIQAINPALVLIEECFYNNITAYTIGTMLDTNPNVRFAVFSYTELDTGQIAYFMDTAASSFINFRLGPDECLYGIDRVIKGYCYIPRNIIKELQNHESPPRIKMTLTKREITILFLLAAGEKTNCIAATLKITEGTVRIHKNHIYAKCGIHSLFDLINFANNLKKQKMYRDALQDKAV